MHAKTTRTSLAPVRRAWAWGKVNGPRTPLSSIRISSGEETRSRDRQIPRPWLILDPSVREASITGWCAPEGNGSARISSTS